MSQFTVPASAVTLKGNTITVNNAKIVGYDGEKFTVEVSEVVAAAPAPVEAPKAAPARSRSTAAPVAAPAEAPKQTRQRRAASVVAPKQTSKVVQLPSDTDDFDTDDIEVIS